MFKDKVTQSVADAASKIMAEELKGNQHKIDKNKNNKIDAHDFKLLRKEEQEQIEELSKETLTSYVGAAKQDNKDHADSRRSGDQEEAKYAKDRMVKRSTGIGAAQNRLNKEETEQILEYETDKNGRYVHKAKPGNYGGSERPTDPFAAVRGPKQSDLSAIEAEKRKKKKKFSEMVDVYQTGGIKELFNEMAIEEEASQEEFNAELEKQKAKAEGKGEKAEVAKAAVQAVQQEEVKDEYARKVEKYLKKKYQKEETETEIQVINADIANGVDSVNIAERELTGAEKAEKENIVKGMKKGMAGFKERYGKDAKSVMYATATARAKGE